MDHETWASFLFAWLASTASSSTSSQSSRRALPGHPLLLVGLHAAPCNRKFLLCAASAVLTAGPALRVCFAAGHKRRKGVLSRDVMNRVVAASIKQALQADTSQGYNGTWRRFCDIAQHYGMPTVVEKKGIFEGVQRTTRVVNVDAVLVFMADFCARGNAARSIPSQLSAIKSVARRIYNVRWFASIFQDQSRYLDCKRSLSKWDSGRPIKQKHPVLTAFACLVWTKYQIGGHLTLDLLEFLVSTMVGVRAMTRVTTLLHLQACHVKFRIPGHQWVTYTSSKSVAHFVPALVCNGGNHELWHSRGYACEVSIGLRGKCNKTGPLKWITFSEDDRFPGPDFFNASTKIVTTSVVDLLLYYLTWVKPAEHAFLFNKFTITDQMADRPAGIPWTSAAKRKHIVQVLASVGLPSVVWSMRRGGLCDYYRQGRSLAYIAFVGRWKSFAFLRYFHACSHIFRATPEFIPVAAGAASQWQPRQHATGSHMSRLSPWMCPK
jgi:hypothetical protein